MTDEVQDRKKNRRRWRRWLVALVAVLVLDFFTFPLFPTRAPVGNQGRNGVWMRYTWYFGEKTEAQWAAMTRMLREQEMRYAFFHMRYIQADGRLHFRYRDKARALVERVHRDAPGVQVVAWIYAENKPGEFFVDAANPAIRRVMVGEAKWLIEECGFDGVQWDYEVIRNNDRPLMDLLRDTRAAMPDTFLSVCTPPWYPGAVTSAYGWDEKYFAEVAAQCDQIAVMGYDTGMPTPRLYASLMSAQAVRVTRAASRGNPHCRVLLGVPTYDELTKSHYPYMENLPIALKAVREGLTLRNANRNAFEGVALFAEYTTSEEEWGQYRRVWLGR